MMPFKAVSLILFLLINISAFTQQKDFEGIVSYTTEVKSKSPWMSDRAAKNLLLQDDHTIVYLKKGNYRVSSNTLQTYYLPDQKRVYLKFRGIDTLFYREYSSDTASVTEIKKLAETKTISGIECKAIVIKTSTSTSKYFYAPSLYMNPDFDKDNTIGQYNIYTRETSSIWLVLQNETATYKVNEVCKKVEQKEIHDSVFKLPDLPVTSFDESVITKTPVFGRAGGFAKYLEGNLKAELGAKYIKIPKGEAEASQVAKVSFMITETGEVADVKVINKGEVHSKLAEEAVRVISQSYGWRPATVLGQKIPYRVVQPITFYVTK